MFLWYRKALTWFLFWSAAHYLVPTYPPICDGLSYYSWPRYYTPMRFYLMPKNYSFQEITAAYANSEESSTTSLDSQSLSTCSWESLLWPTNSSCFISISQCRNYPKITCFSTKWWSPLPLLDMEMSVQSQESKWTSSLEQFPLFVVPL